MNGFRRPAARVLARLFRTSAVGCCILFAGAQTIAAEASSLDFTVSDVFPVTRSDLGFTDDPEVLLLAQASTPSETRKSWAHLKQANWPIWSSLTEII